MTDPWQVPLPPELAGVEEPFSDDELAQAIAAQAVGITERQPVADDDVPEAVRRWQVADDNGAEWAARKWRAAHDEVARVMEQADEWRSRITEWEREQRKRAEATMLFFGAHLEAYALARREATGEATLRLPSATVSTTNHKPKAVVAKPEEFMEWAQEHAPHLTRQADPEPALSEFRKTLDVVWVVDRALANGELEECGHDVTFQLLPGQDVTTMVFSCGACEPDPIDGAPMRPLAAWRITDTERHQGVVLKGTTEEIPGLGVEPESTSAKVRP